MERRALIGLAAAAVAAFSMSLDAWPALVALPVLLYAAVRPVVPRSWRPARWGGGIVAGGVALLPLLVTFQTLSTEAAVRIAVPAGILLSLLMAGLFWAGAELVIPGAVALLGAAALGRESIALQALFGVAGLCAVIHLASYRAIRLVPLVLFVVGSGAVAWGVVRFLPWAQPWVEGKAGDLLAPARTARAGLSLTSRLGEIEELGLSPEVALRVWSERAQYLRARVYRAFNGRVWSPGEESVKRPMTPAPDLDADLLGWLAEVPGRTWATGSAAGGAPIRSRILLERRLPAGVLLAPGGVELARLGENPATVDAAGVLEPRGTSPELYALVNHPSIDGPAPGADCLDASAEVDRRMQDLALRLGREASAEERIRRTLSYLETTCTYSLQVGPFLSKDPVGEFVFDKRQGYCEYFASAAALLLRMEGVPARYVVGYSVRPENREGGHYVVREADAHAWVEAWLDGKGWVELDPTPAASFTALRRSIRGGIVSGLWEGLKAWVALLRIGGLGAGLRSWVYPLLGGVAAVVVAGLLSYRRFRRRTKTTRPRAAEGDVDPVPPELRELLSRLDRHWTRSGHPRPTCRAPLEHLLALPESVRSGRDVIDALYRCRYGGQAPSGAEIAGLRRGMPGS